MQKIAIPNINDFQTYILDMDGTLCFGKKIIPGAKEFVDNLRSHNKNIFVVTNNSAGSPEFYAKRLQSMGLDIKLKEVINSTMSLYQWLLKNNLQQKKYFIFGTNAMKKQLAKLGINHSEQADYVIIGNNTEFTWSEFVKASNLIVDGAPYIVSNPDLRMPLEPGYFSPDAGLITQMMNQNTLKKPLVVLGKPKKEMIENLISGPSLFIGDRIYTDMVCAKNANINNCLTLSGEAKEKDYLESNVEIDYVINSINDLKEEYE